jgi:catechol 2,3-dioxygenase-like lactoylglutathione lyase family enzyme
MSDALPPQEDKPVIVAPVSRCLAVAAIDRSLVFYRDVLGFNAGSVRDENGVPALVEVKYGPAVIQLGVHESAPDSTGTPRPRGSAILFFQTDDVAMMRDAVIARGGQPSELEKVNWIKMRMFEIKDPDGHTLWFGQSFQQPDSPRAAEYQLRKIMPSLPLSDVRAGVAYYRDVLGFNVNYAQDDIGVMDRDDVTVLLIARTDKHTGIGSCYVYIRDADGLHAELMAKGANVQGEPVSHPWGLRDFEVHDLEGNQIRFGQTFE